MPSGQLYTVRSWPICAVCSRASQFLREGLKMEEWEKEQANDAVGIKTHTD